MELLRQIVPPLSGAIVASVFSYLIFVRIANRFERTLELIKLYSSSEMEKARREAWEFLRHRSNVAEFARFLIGTPGSEEVDREQHERFQQAQRVFDFFALLDESLRISRVDARLVQRYLIYYYSWWKEFGLDQIRVEIGSLPRGSRILPAWCDPLDHLEQLHNLAPR